MPASQYHADPVIVPSLSRSVAEILINRSPRHARHAHPRLTPQPPSEATAAMDAGSALHKLILGKGDDIAVLPFDDYKSKAARDAKVESRAANRIPILADVAKEIADCARAVTEQIHDDPHLAGFYQPEGRSEVVIIAQINGIWCRSMVDRLNTKTGQAYDLKTTNLSAAPWVWDRRFQTAYATQDDFYRRMLRAVGFTAAPPMIFLPIEQGPPFGMCALAADSILQGWAASEIDEALETWSECLRTNSWPGYQKGIHLITATSRQIEDQEFSRSNRQFTPKPSARALQAAADEFYPLSS
jgi:hypothetical protein